MEEKLMNLILGIESFRQKVIDNYEGKKIDAWLNYYRDYKQAFDVLFERLYMTDIDSLMPLINTLNFEDLYIQSQKSLSKYSLDEITNIITQCVNYFNHFKEFYVYLLVGLGSSDGAAPPSDSPFLYLGLELLHNADTNFLIPHEFNHLVRFHHLKKYEDFNKISVKQLIVAEGLATITPLIIHNLKLTEENFMKALMVNREYYIKLRQNYMFIEKEIQADMNKILNPDLVKKYFMGDNRNGKIPKVGYYAGFRIILELIKKGEILSDLTVTNTEDILNKYRNLKEL
jgi:uncharacterized protein YjaZ